MKRILGVCLFMLFSASIACAEIGKSEKIYDALVVASGTVNTSRVFSVGSIKNTGNVGIWYKATSALGNPNMHFFLEESPDETATNFATIKTISASLTTETAVVVLLNPVPMKYWRFKAQTNGPQHSGDTIFTAYVFTQE